MSFRYFIVIVSLAFTSLLCNAKECKEAIIQLEKGKALYENERYMEATASFIDAMKAAKKQGDARTYTRGLYDLGMVYVRMDDMERALYYFSMCYERAKNTGDEVMQGKCASYMATCYAFATNLDMARKFYSLQLKLPHESENLKQYYMLYNGGLICFLEKKYDRAALQFHLAIECVKKHRLDRKYLQTVYGLMVYIQIQKNNTEEALRCCEEYRRSAQNGKRKLWKEAYYEMLCDVYSAAGDSMKGKMYRRMADSTFNARIEKQQIKAIDNRIVKFEGKTNWDDIQALNSTVYRQWQFIIVCVLFVMVLIILFVVIVMKNRSLKHAYRLVISKNRELVIAGQMSQKIRQHGGEAPVDDNPAPASVPEEKRETAIEGESQETTPNDILLTQTQIDELLQKVSAAMGDVDVISRGDFTLVALAQMVGSNTRYVSWVINNTYHKNFKTLLNEYRIREVCRRMEDKANFGHLTIQALSNSLGYSSPSNFLRAFKNVNGMTPSMYQKLISEKKIDEAGE